MTLKEQLVKMNVILDKYPDGPAPFMTKDFEEKNPELAKKLSDALFNFISAMEPILDELYKNKK